jgi:hypothetical protein
MACRVVLVVEVREAVRLRQRVARALLVRETMVGQTLFPLIVALVVVVVRVLWVVMLRMLLLALVALAFW